MLLKNILLNAAYYAVTLVGLPWLVYSLDLRYGWVGTQQPILQGVSLLVLVAGAALQVWCIVLFHRKGRGTPSPLLAPRRLVTCGPYSRLRNPMNLGEAMTLLGLAGWFSSPGLLLYFVFACVAFHVFVVRWEEPRLLETFGDEYQAYQARVSRWGIGRR